MNFKSNRKWIRVLVVLLGLGFLLAGFGQEAAESKSAAPTTAKEGVKWPTKPVTILVGMAAGGTTDVVARAVQPYFQKEFGKNVIIKNVEGAGGNVGLTELWKAKPDGYTLAIYAFPSAFLKELSMDARFKSKEFSYIEGIIGGDMNAIFVKLDSPYKDMKELLEAAKTKRVTVSGSGVGTNSHMAMILMQKATGVSFEYVPYQGGNQALTAVVGGHTMAGISNMSAAKQLVVDKKARYLASFGEKRNPDFPDVPTMDDLGIKDLAINVTVGLIGPPGVPDEIIKKASDAADKALQNPELVKLIWTQGSQQVVPLKSDKFKKVAFALYDQAYKVKDDIKAVISGKNTTKK